jgi:hypothetical protein
MTDEETSKKPADTISERDRFRYIGFEVFPGKVRDLFKSDAEKQKMVEKVVAKRLKGETVREDCKLLEKRVGIGDRIALTVASVVILASLFLPWYSAYNEIVEQTGPAPVRETVADSAMLAGMASDSVPATAGDPGGAVLAGAVSQPSEAAAAEEDTTEGGVSTATSGGSGEEILHTSMARRTRIHREYDRLSGVGAFLALGGVGSYIFSSGFVLMLTAIIFITYMLACIALPVYTLYGLYGLKGDADGRALQLKKILRLSWLPVVLFVVTLIISFVGADYGFDPATVYDSMGTGYGVGVFINTLSWGIIISLFAFVLAAAKGIEI